MAALLVLGIVVGCGPDGVVLGAPSGRPHPGGKAGDSGTADSGGGSDSGGSDTSDTGGAPDDATPETCTEVRAAHPGADDGEYTLYVGGDAASPWTAWCADMAGAPAEYLTVDPAGGRANYSEYAVSRGDGSTVKTVYSRLRIHPRTFLVDISDQTFSSSTGALNASGVQVTSMPYAVAMSCERGVYGSASIDLGGTPFVVAADAFVVAGYEADGQATYSRTRDAVDLSGGGYCGWINPAPEVYNPVNDAGDFQLGLEYGG